MRTKLDDEYSVTFELKSQTAIFYVMKLIRIVNPDSEGIF